MTNAPPGELDVLMTEHGIDFASLAEMPLDHINGGATSLVRQPGSASVCCVLFYAIIHTWTALLQGGYLEHVFRHAAAELFNVGYAHPFTLSLICIRSTSSTSSMWSRRVRTVKRPC